MNSMTVCRTPANQYFCFAAVMMSTESPDGRWGISTFVMNSLLK